MKWCTFLIVLVPVNGTADWLEMQFCSQKGYSKSWCLCPVFSLSLQVSELLFILLSASKT